MERGSRSGLFLLRVGMALEQADVACVCAAMTLGSMGMALEQDDVACVCTDSSLQDWPSEQAALFKDNLSYFGDIYEVTTRA